jgi:hypothetical protein
MYRDSFAGTRTTLKLHIETLKLPDTLPAHDAIRAFILAHVPTYGNERWSISVSVESESNLHGNRIAGFMSVGIMEV